MATILSPLHETLFRAWAKAHGIDNHDDPANQFDHRGVYSRTNGAILPPGHLNSMADNHNAMMVSQEQGPGPDPMAAAAEQQKLQQKAEADHRKDMTKIMVERMKLEHKTKENALDRDHKAQQSQLDRGHQTQSALHAELFKRTAPQGSNTAQ